MKPLLSVLALLIFVGCSPTYKVNGRNMEPILMPGDEIGVDAIAFESSPPSRFELIVFKLQTPPFDIRALRIVGLPGEKIEIKEKGIFINDSAIDLPYEVNGSFVSQGIATQPNNHLTELVEAEHYYVLGDNLDHSFDSRLFGAISASSILGRARIK